MVRGVQLSDFAAPSWSTASFCRPLVPSSVAPLLQGFLTAWRFTHLLAHISMQDCLLLCLLHRCDHRSIDSLALIVKWPAV